MTGGTSGAFNLSVYPNPLESVGTISWRAPRGEEVTIRVIDERGIVVREQTEVSKGEGSVSLSTDELSSGSYVVELRSGSDVLTSKVQVRK